MSGVTIYWGYHLENFKYIPIEFDPTFDSIENSLLDHLIDELWMQNQYFLILIDGVPYEWEVESVR